MGSIGVQGQAEEPDVKVHGNAGGSDDDRDVVHALDADLLAQGASLEAGRRGASPVETRLEPWTFVVDDARVGTVGGGGDDRASRGEGTGRGARGARDPVGARGTRARASRDAGARTEAARASAAGGIGVASIARGEVIRGAGCASGCGARRTASASSTSSGGNPTKQHFPLQTGSRVVFGTRGTRARAPVHVGGPRARSSRRLPRPREPSFPLASLARRERRSRCAPRASPRPTRPPPTPCRARADASAGRRASRSRALPSPSPSATASTAASSPAPFSSQALVKADQVAVHREDGVGDLVGFASSPAVERFDAPGAPPLCTPPWPRKMAAVPLTVFDAADGVEPPDRRTTCTTRTGSWTSTTNSPSTSNPAAEAAPSSGRETDRWTSLRDARTPTPRTPTPRRDETHQHHA